MGKERHREVPASYAVLLKDGKVLLLRRFNTGYEDGRYSLPAGHVAEGESFSQCAIREAKEEIGVEIKKEHQVAELSFFFPHNPAWNQKVHVYFSEVWDGEPSESDEMKPKWFSTKKIPFNQMWPDDIFWLPEVLSGKLVKATFIFGEGDVIQSKDIQIVESFS